MHRAADTRHECTTQSHYPDTGPTSPDFIMHTHMQAHHTKHSHTHTHTHTHKGMGGGSVTTFQNSKDQKWSVPLQLKNFPRLTRPLHDAVSLQSAANQNYVLTA